MNPLKRYPWLEHLLVLAYFALLTVLFTYPLVFNLGTSVLGKPGDNVYGVWLIHWYDKVFFGGNWHPFFNPWMNYPAGWNLSTTETYLAIALPGVLVSQLWNSIAGYNVACLLTFVLSGYFMYLWVRHVSGSSAAALIAGTIFAFIPWRMAQFRAGHPNLIGTQWFPLYFWALYELLDLDKPKAWLWAILAAVSLGLIGLTSMYFLYFTLIISVIYLMGLILFSSWRKLLSPRFWGRMALFAVLAAPLVFLALKPYLGVSGSGGLASRSVAYASMYSASPTDFILPSTDHFLFGVWVMQHFDRSLWIEGTFYIGAASLVLGIIAFIFRKKLRLPALIDASVGVAAAAFILALGIDLHWNNQEVIVKIPQFLQALLHKSTTPLYLPAYWLFNHLPFYDKMRALERIGVFTLVFTSFLAGLGAVKLLEGKKRTIRLLLTGLVLAVVLFEFYPGPFTNELTQIEPRPVDLWLGQQPGSGAVVQMPFSESGDQYVIYCTMFQNKPFVGGFFNANQPPQYLAIEPVLENFPDQASIAQLKTLKVAYVVVDSSQYSDYSSVDATIKSLGLQLLTDQEGQYVYGWK
jgi:hypothetical protein